MSNKTISLHTSRDLIRFYFFFALGVSGVTEIINILESQQKCDDFSLRDESLACKILHSTAVSVFLGGVSGSVGKKKKGKREKARRCRVKPITNVSAVAVSAR